jgi:hypothetical protein
MHSGTHPAERRSVIPALIIAALGAVVLIAAFYHFAHPSFPSV